jgi:hypothetical protein
MLRTFPKVWRWLKYPVALALAGIGLVLAFYGAVMFLFGGVAVGLWTDIAAIFILSIWSLGLAITLARRPRPSAAKPAGMGWRVLRLLAIAIGLASFCFAISPYVAGEPLLIYRGHFDRPRLEQIVAQVRQLDFKGYQLLFVDPSGKVRKGQDKSPGLHDWIDAERADDGTLSVVIVTRNYGHAGVYGFAYCDKILTPEPDEISYGGLSLPVPGGVCETDRNGKIDDHWWKVANTQT